MGIKISDINALRRELVSKLEEKITSSFKRSLLIDEEKQGMGTDSDSRRNQKDESKTLEKDIVKKSKKEYIEVYFYSWEDFIESSDAPENYSKVAILPLADILLHQISQHDLQAALHARGYADWHPYISNISLGREDGILEENTAKTAEFAKNGGIYLGNLEWYEFFKEAGCKLYADFGLNCYNAKTRQLLEDMGFAKVEPSSETYDERNGAYPLMTAEHQINADVLIDRKNVEMRIINRPFSDQMVLTLNGIKWYKFGNSTRFYYSQ